MRITLVGGASSPSPRNAALLHSLSRVGHDVSTATIDKARFGRRRFPACDIVIPANDRVLDHADDAAELGGAWVWRRPDWAPARRDLIDSVPRDPSLSVPVDAPPSEPQPWLQHRGRPAPGRHRRRRVVLVFRSTPASPAHALHQALLRAGAAVHVTDRLDFASLPPHDLVVIVESPVPPLEVVGDSRNAPVAYWVHHGEHHVEANVRLADQYGADLVLMAHSWHLAVRFDRRVERFPFGAQPVDDPPPFPRRDYDLGFVGSTAGTAYARRRRLLEHAQATLPAVWARNDVAPSQVVDLYSNSRAVLNDGGTRHLPITMRVFEAMAAGAVLVTDPVPGLDLILPDGYIAAGDLEESRLDASLADPQAEALAQQGHRSLRELHTYDHRVDLLFRFADSIRHEHRPATPPEHDLDRFLFDHPFSQRILDATGTVEAPDREVWRVEDLTSDPRPGSFHTLVADRRTPLPLLNAARRFIVGRDIDPAGLPVEPRSVHRLGKVTVVDVGGAAYDVATVGGPPDPG